MGACSAVAIAIQSLGRASISMIFFCCDSFSTLMTSLAELEIVDDCPFDLRSERSQYVCYQIMGKRPFLWRVLHEHRDRRSDALIDEHHEYLVLVAKENCPAAAGRSHGANLNFDNPLTHTASLVIRLHAKMNCGPHRADPTVVSRVLEQPNVPLDLLLISSRPFHYKPAVSESRRALLSSGRRN